MAIVKLRDVEVTRVNNSGFGVQVAEKFQVQGKDRQTRFTVWFEEPHGLTVGDRVSLSGFLGAKVGEPWVGQDGQERRSVELSVNKPRIEDSANAGNGGGNSGHHSSGSQQWGNAPQMSDANAFGGGFSGDDASPF